MNQRLKILMLEDNTVDAELIQRLLKKEIPLIELRLTMTEKAFIAELDQFRPDVILADNSLPKFSAAEALKITRNHSLFIPFIMVTGTVSDEFAATIIKQGADDYILKDRLIRLPTAIESALKQREAEKEKQEAQEKLIQSEEKYRSLFQNSPLPILVFDVNSWQCLDVNEAAIQKYGYSQDEFRKIDVTAITADEDMERHKSERSVQGIGYREMGVWKHIKKDGSCIMVKIFSHDILYKNNPARMVLAEDITERIKTEEALKEIEAEITNQKIQQQKKISRAIIKAEERERNHIGQELHDNITQILAGTKMFLSMAGNKNEVVKEVVKYPMELIDSAINEIRLLSSTHVTPLRDIRLNEMAQLIVAYLAKTSAIKVEYIYDIINENFDDDLKLNIYRIIQEQVNNIVKHSEAKNVTIKLTSGGEYIMLVITDDGKGFDLSKKRSGIGISNIMNRIESYNGKIVIDSKPGKGCRTEVTIPVSLSKNVPE